MRRTDSSIIRAYLRRRLEDIRTYLAIVEAEITDTPSGTARMEQRWARQLGEWLQIQLKQYEMEDEDFEMRDPHSDT